jgi:hypothetical protein
MRQGLRRRSVFRLLQQLADSRATDCLLLTEFEENQLTGYIISWNIAPPFIFYKRVTT